MSCAEGFSVEVYRFLVQYFLSPLGKRLVWPVWSSTVGTDYCCTTAVLQIAALVSFNYLIITHTTWCLTCLTPPPPTHFSMVCATHCALHRRDDRLRNL